VTVGFRVLVSFLGERLDLPSWSIDSGLYAHAVEWSSA